MALSVQRLYFSLTAPPQTRSGIAPPSGAGNGQFWRLGDKMGR
ncbi:MAG: hypothetical protein ACK5CA_12930 [Cyanobacteriota bacterium]